MNSSTTKYRRSNKSLNPVKRGSIVGLFLRFDRRRVLGQGRDIGNNTGVAVAAIGAIETGRSVVFCIIRAEGGSNLGQDFVSRKFGCLFGELILVVEGVGSVYHQSVHIVPKTGVVMIHPWLLLSLVVNLLDGEGQGSTGRKL